MRYWDSSALVPLIADEPRTGDVRRWLSDEPAVVTWAWTRVEIVSAIERRAREGRLTRSERRLALDRVAAVADTWDEVTDIVAVRARALPLLGRHPLRAADAAQLAAALLVRDELAAPLTFVCLDERLTTAAEREGLATLPSA